MLNIFPSLLIYGFFAPTVLRIAVALLSFYVVYATWHHKGKHETLGWASMIANAVVGIMLLVGYFTQIAALVALLFRLASFVMPKKYRDFVPLPMSTRLIVAAICISLLLTGAGALAFDLPL